MYIQVYSFTWTCKIKNIDTNVPTKFAPIIPIAANYPVIWDTYFIIANRVEPSFVGW